MYTCRADGQYPPCGLANAGQAGATMGDQRVDSVLDGWPSRMDDHSGWLVDDDVMLIEQDIQVDGFALRC